MGLFDRLKQWERDIRAHYNQDLTTPENRRRANIYNLWFDHAVLRILWTNQHEVAPGVYRSNQPTHARFEKLKAQGIKSILNLRGSLGKAHYLTEVESCEKLGLTLISANLHARRAATRDEITAVLEAFRSIEKPFVMHCKSGADRAGFAAALYLMVIEKRPLREARRMLSLRFIHLRWSKTGILDYILDVYEARTKRAPISFEDWIATEYDGATMQAEYRQNIPPARASAA